MIKHAVGDAWLVKFHYVNGLENGYEAEFVDLVEGKLMVRRDSASALRSAAPAFRGEQLQQVYDKLQVLVEEL